MEKIKKKYLYVILLFAILILPFSISQRNDPINPQPIDDSTVGYYQSTTCKISLLEFYSYNFDNNNIKIYFNNNDYADLKCFGKITGVDKVKNTFFVSIGTNTSINLIFS